ncbi:alpha/beta fold hydrolase [Actinokineospora fastidiosa]|uniref:Alpha/beta hydrolase n=1 Tax=Actinokineospora fastidiosa TaxID=1816 RepID=A0A918GD37_9PSEU|nr:alpha/beta hydrolase [Actinokineospora fastidiosa]GGS29471.1 alpha/beta hydrolase [Actinokineospora fastidiosa]
MTPAVVLVPGAFTGAWMWADVAAGLRRRGIAASAIDLPSIGPDAGDAGFAADVRAVRRALDRLEPPVLLCGHSYGGGVITESAAGPHPAVRRLVYVNAAVPDIGDSLVSLMTAAVARARLGERPDRGVVLRGDGLAHLDREYARRVLFNDCGPDRAEAALARLSPTNPSGSDRPLAHAAWRDLPATYLRGTEDRLVEAIAPAFIAHGPELVEFPVGHCPQWSRPELVVDLLADRALGMTTGPSAAERTRTGDPCSPNSSSSIRPSPAPTWTATATSPSRT